MSIANFIDVQALGRHFAIAIQDLNAPVHEVWMREFRGAADIWIITRMVELDEERAVYQVVARLIDEFPDHYLDIKVLNPNNLGEGSDPHDELPHDVEQIAVSQA